MRFREIEIISPWELLKQHQYQFSWGQMMDTLQSLGMEKLEKKWSGESGEGCNNMS